MAGYGNQYRDPDLLTFLSGFPIICLPEIWVLGNESSLLIQGSDLPLIQPLGQDFLSRQAQAALISVNNGEFASESSSARNKKKKILHFLTYCPEKIDLVHPHIRFTVTKGQRRLIF